MAAADGWSVLSMMKIFWTRVVFITMWMYLMPLKGHSQNQGIWETFHIFLSQLETK